MVAKGPDAALVYGLATALARIIHKLGKLWFFAPAGGKWAY